MIQFQKKMLVWGAGLVFSLSGVGHAQQQASQYKGPKATVYIGNNWCYGSYCGRSGHFATSLDMAMMRSGYIQPMRKRDSSSLILRAGISSYGNSRGRVCLPVVGCVSGRTVLGSIELSDRVTGAVIYRDKCEGTSAGYSNWRYWAGSLNLSTDDQKAAADCAAKLVQRLTTRKVKILQPYLNNSSARTAAKPAAPVKAVPPVKTTPAQPAAPVTSTPPKTPVPATPAATDPSPVNMLGGHLKSLAFDQINALFTSDPYNPVKVKELKEAATAATLVATKKLQFKVTSGENMGTYQLVGLTYTLPEGGEKFVQLAVTSDSKLNTRGGNRIVYLSEYNPMRASNPALGKLSSNVETMFNDLHKALSLPGLQ